MSRATLLVAGLAGITILGGAAFTRISRANVQTLERNSDVALEKMVDSDPPSILGSTRGVYLDGYGIVFSAELELAPRDTPNPFRPAFTKEDYTKLREKKRVRLGQLRTQMRNMMMQYASSLEALPANENVALAVTVLYSKFEDSTGMPRQVVMAAPRRALLEAKRGSDASLSATLKVREDF